MVAASVDGNKKATCKVTVKIPLAGITLNKTTLPLNKGASETLVAVIIPVDATNKAITWTSTNTAVAAVDSTGKVTAVGDGTCTITATTTDGAKTAICQVTVRTPVTGVVLNKTNLPMIKGANETLTTAIAPLDATNKAVTWASSNNSVAAVDTAGKVTAVGAGGCNITVTTLDGSKKSACSVLVTVPVASVSLNSGSLFFEKNDSSKLVATVLPSDADNKNVSWSTSDSSVASVSSDGLVTAKSGGICYITAITADSGLKATCTVNVASVFYITTPVLADSCDSFFKVINIGGKSDASIIKASWQIDSKHKGSCKVSNGVWTASKVGLVLGNNLITVTGFNKNKQTIIDTLLVKYVDNIKPEVKISSASSKPTTKALAKISGTAMDLEAIVNVTWTNAATGASGVCTGTKSWKASGIALNLGYNEITISAEDSSGNVGTSKIIVTMVDKTKPKVTITAPTTKSSLIISEQNITLGGTASDDIEVAKIEWSNKLTGANGICSGTTAWSSAIPVQIGKNSIQIRATDTSGNQAFDSITVTRK